MVNLNAKKFTLFIVVVGLCNFLLTGCVVNDLADANKEASKFSAVSIVDPVFDPQPNNSFAWYSELFVDDSSSEVKISKEARNTVTRLISKSIMEKNYKVVEISTNADYLISAMVILGEKNIEKAAPLFKLYPQIAESINHYDDGTLFVAISRNQDDHAPIMWKSAVQAYVVGEDLSEEEQTIRLEGLIKRLMSDLP